jgi:DNA-repair protein XRCC3
MSRPRRVLDIYNESKLSLATSLLVEESNVPLFKERSISLGCHLIDNVTGGIKTQGITEIVGEAGCGKTQCCLILSLHNHLSINQGGLNGSCAYLCCGEGEFPIKRLSQLASIYEKKYNIPALEFLNNIHIEMCLNTENVLETISSRLPEMCQKLGVTLIIVDSLAGAIRCEYDIKSSKEMKDRTSKLFCFSSNLKRLADSYKVAIVVVNQVTGGGFTDKQEKQNALHNNNNNFFDMNKSTIPALGLAWSHCINTRIMLRKDENTVRSILAMSDTEKENLRQQIALYENNNNERKEDNDYNDMNMNMNINKQQQQQQHHHHHHHHHHQQQQQQQYQSSSSSSYNREITNDYNTTSTSSSSSSIISSSSSSSSSKSVRYMTLEFSPTNPSRTVQYEITLEGIKGIPVPTFINTKI